MLTPEDLEAIRRADREIAAQMAAERRAARKGQKAKKTASPSGETICATSRNSQRIREYRHRNPDKVRQWRRNYTERHRDEINARRREKQRKAKEEKQNES